MSELLRVLQIEDCQTDAALIVRTLAKAGYEVHAKCVEESQDMRTALLERVWDVIIAEYHLPAFDAPAALEVLRETALDIPFIVVSGAVGEEHAVATMKAGAHDYVLKENLARLGPAVAREVKDARARRERRKTEAELDASKQRLQAQQEILEHQNKSLERTEALLREIHHRVKNNLQVVSSLLHLQARASSNVETSRMLEDIRDRIHSMALLHETLYESDNLAVVNFARYIGQLIEGLMQSCGVDRNRVRVRSALQPFGLDLDVALPGGLIIHEVLSNSLKHAFPDGRGGEVRIDLTEQPSGTVSLVMADNGIGLGDIDVAASKSLGFRLINILARQLNAAVAVDASNGTEFRLTFPMSAAGNAELLDHKAPKEL